MIIADAYREAEQLRGQGDASAAEIYAQAFEKDREFYKFFRSLRAYQESFDGSNDLMLLEPDGEFFEYFNQGRQ